MIVFLKGFMDIYKEGNIDWWEITKLLLDVLTLSSFPSVLWENAAESNPFQRELILRSFVSLK